MRCCNARPAHDRTANRHPGAIDTSGAPIDTFDWRAVEDALNDAGNALLPGLLTPEACDALAALYPRDSLYRSRVVMARHGFGRGEYKYFAYPLPGLIEHLRTQLYPRLAPIANRWNQAMGIDVRYPAAHADFLRRCHDAGQLRPTPLILQYGPATTTACTRTSTASTSFRCRWRSCCPSPARTSPAANS